MLCWWRRKTLLNPIQQYFVCKPLFADVYNYAVIIMSLAVMNCYIGRIYHSSSTFAVIFVQISKKMCKWVFFSEHRVYYLHC